MAFYALEHLSHLFDGYKKPFKVAGRDVLLLHVGGRSYIIENRCPHMDVPLASGTLLSDQKIRCRAHGIEFDLNSGRASGALADSLDCLVSFTPVYEGSRIGVDL